MKRTTSVLVLMLLLLAGAVTWQFLQPAPDGPVYKGKPLSYWLKDQLAHPPLWREDGTPPSPYMPQGEAYQAVVHAGSNAIPTLLRMLEAKDSPLKVQLMDWAYSLRLVRNNYQRAEGINLIAADTFELLAPTALDAVPAVIKILDRNISPASQTAALRALGHLGYCFTNAIPCLLRYAGSGVPKVRAAAITALHESGLERVAGMLENALRSPDAAVQQEALGWIKALGPDGGFLISTLASYGPSGEPIAGVNAIRALGYIGPRAQPTMPTLLLWLTNANAAVRSEAQIAIRKIDPSKRL